MRFVCCAFLVLMAIARAATLPLNVGEISLMLRAGYTSGAVERELETRHFADALDNAKRKALIDAGATPQLLDALSSGRFTVPPAELERAEQQRAEQARQRALAAERDAKEDSLYRDQVARQHAFATAQAAADIVAPILKGNLIHAQNGALAPLDDAELSRKKLYGLYFSAHWCAPCRKFTPQLVTWYNNIARAHPEFEIVFISADKSADAMTGYMREAAMPWPAVDYARLPNVAALTKYAGNGIPDLVIIDNTGKVLADSFVNGNYVGPAQVLNKLDALFARSAAVAAR